MTTGPGSRDTELISRLRLKRQCGSQLFLNFLAPPIKRGA
jgi:hypothetical protein